MSDILIKNMEMPDKVTTIVIFPEGQARVFRQDIDHDEWLRATAIEVPTPHGRLIDADAMADEIWKIMRFPSNLANAQFFVNTLREAPTIIEEDGKDINVLGKEEGE